MRANIVVRGERELRRDLRKLAADSTWKGELRGVHKRAADAALPDVRKHGSKTRRNRAGGPARLGSKGLSTIRSLASQTKASVALGTAGVPWAAGNERGSRGGRRTRQFPVANAEGYILQPGIDDAMPEIVTTYRRGIDQLIKRHFGA